MNTSTSLVFFSMATRHTYTFENWILETNAELDCGVVETLPRSLTPYLASKFQHFQVAFINMNVPISDSTFYKQVVEGRLLGYSAQVVTHGQDSFYYFAVLPVDMDAAYVPAHNIKATKVRRPKASMRLRISFPRFVLVQTQVRSCSVCKQSSVLLGGCKNAGCEAASLVELFDPKTKISLSDRLTKNSRTLLLGRSCPRCLRCRLCQRLSQYCNRHKICRHSKLQAVPNMRRALVGQGFLACST